MNRHIDLIDDEEAEFAEVEDGTPGVADTLAHVMGDLAVALGILSNLTGWAPDFFLPPRPDETMH